jgi:hypothetical protein
MNPKQLIAATAWGVYLALGFGYSVDALACPFCAALSNSLREDMALADHVALAICQVPAQRDSQLPLHEMRITRVYQGDPAWDGMVVEVFSFRPLERGSFVLLMGVGEDLHVDWGPSAALESQALAYVEQIALRLSEEEPRLTDAMSPRQDVIPPVDATSPAASVQTLDMDRKRKTAWLMFFWQSLASEDEWVRRDAFNEFARASLEDLRALVQELDADEVVSRLRDPDSSLEQRRLYWTILSLCGRQQDVDLVRRAIFERSRSQHSGLAASDIGLDAAISCFLVLGGEAALTQIEEGILGNRQAESSDRYAAIVAIRVHAVEFKLIPNARLAKALELVLSELSLADLVIPDLARLQDWSHVSRMVELFSTATDENRFVRMPAINYLRACPLPEAELALAKCKAIDPEAFRRATVLFPKPPSTSDR